MAVSSNEKMQNQAKRVMFGSRDPLLEFWLKLETSYLARRMMAVSSNEKMQK